MAIFKRNSSSVPVPFDSVRFATSWLLPPSVLFILRALISLYLFISVITTLALLNKRNPSTARHYFSYFTSLTYWGLAFYFAFAAAHTGSYWRSGNPFLSRWPKVLQHMHSIYYSTITTYPFLVTIVYWALIYIGFNDQFEWYKNISEHALNSVFALFEIFIPRTAAPPILHVVPAVIILALYLGLAYVTLASNHFYVYSFLDPKNHSRGVIAGYIIGILVGTIIVFFIVHFVIKGRRWVIEEKMGKRGKFTLGRVSGEDIERADVYVEK
ncbi:hypothetical protein EJ08DRAFT_578633 [Tothia fuscella]|uniref:Uncharacterized protein n=1 Tax=Tothia fuscella TaxID=1048955 RepID=A0A9P4P455_9PEZI|nr:hypothetical protein EJ08DRAFT_578633 [Tothia fuscella]